MVREKKRLEEEYERTKVAREGQRKQEKEKRRKQGLGKGQPGGQVIQNTDRGD